MKKKKRKNRVILAICSMFIAVMSIFAFIPNNKEIVKADTVDTSYYYNGSNLYLPCTILYSNNGTQIDVGNIGPFSINFSFGTRSSDNIVTDFSITFNTKDMFKSAFFYRNAEPYFSTRSDIQMNLYTYNGYQYFTRYTLRFYNSNGEINSDTILGAPVKFSLVGYKADGNTNIFYELNYFDKDNNYLNIAWTLQSAGIQNIDYLLISRTYYLINPYADFSDNEYYNLGYSNGYDKGKFDGKIEGQNSGYDSGYINGKNDGYNLGYNQGVENANSYTFDSLLSAVIDVPVKTFTSLFNFEILGVNLSGFFLGLLTCCIVITIIRLIL